MMNVRDRDLGMHRDVTRRDVLNGVALALTSATLAVIEARTRAAVSHLTRSSQ
jgi:hypothetical protein